MKTQISRNAHDARKQYTGVYQQQGRMITDADWNALTDIGKEQLVTALADAIAAGAPRDGGLGLNSDRTIRPGVLYVDGHRGELPGTDPIGLKTQAHYPTPPPLPAGNIVIYADLWERCVTALEDGQLMDAGLHGADTTTRLQQMLQVKWASNTLDPNNTASNPTIGSSGLALRLRKILVGSDPCDPCASEVDLDERVGNYLFRTEIHDLFDNTDGDTILTLKWSRDNGSECYPSGNIPEGFDVDDWVWEFFDSDSEKTLGRHFPPTHRPRRGVLRTEFAPPAGGEPADFVRQWDGFASLNLSTNMLIQGMDRGAQLGDDLGPDAHGFARFDSGVLTINGELLEMRWHYRDIADQLESLLVGDFWQAEVRETVRSPGDFVLGSETDGAPPEGIAHHYLLLGEVDAGGSVQALSDAGRRRFNFPPLTDITAADVGFTDNCPGLYGGAENVQGALDALCAIAADDIAWVDPGCPDSVRELLAASLGAWPDLDADGKTSVKDALDALFCHLSMATLPYNLPSCGDAGKPTVRKLLSLAPGIQPAANALNALLCQLRATHIPLDKEGELCAALKAPSVLTVQDALQVLCTRGGTACAIPVEPGGQLMELLKAFGTNKDAVDIWLCLRPGEHVLEGDLNIAAKAGIKLVGAGCSRSLIRFDGRQLVLGAGEIHLEDLGFQATNTAGSLLLQADTLSGCHCEFTRATGSAANAVPLLHWQPPSDHRDNVSIHWQNNRMSSYWRRLLLEPAVVAPGNLVGPVLSERITDLFVNEALLADQNKMRKATEAVAADILALPATQKERWSVTMARNVRGFNRVASPTVLVPMDTGNDNVRRRVDNVVPSRPVQPGSGERALATNAAELAAVGREAISGASIAEVADRLDDLVASVAVYEHNVALAVASGDHRGTISDNQIYADVVLFNGRSKGVELSASNFKGFSTGLDNAILPQGQLRFSGNWVHRVTSMIESGTIKNGLFSTPVSAYQRLVVCDNTFTGGENSFIGAAMTMQGNAFPENPGKTRPGIALCETGTYTSNLGFGDNPSFIVAARDAGRVIITHNKLFMNLLN